MDDYQVEFGTKEGYDDADFLNHVEREYHTAQRVKEQRRGVVLANRQEIWKVQNMVDEADNIVGRTQVYKSPILASLIERLIGSNWIPSFRFEPQQPDDIYIAKNGNRVHDMMLNQGNFEKAVKEAGFDLFSAGRGYLLKGYETMQKGDREVPSVVTWSHIKWEYCYHTENFRSFMIYDPDFTPDRLIEEFGPGIKKYAIVEGQPFTDNKFGNERDSLDWEDGEQRIGVMRFYNGVRKQYGIIIGGGSLIYDLKKGKKYPQAWIDQWDKGFVPVDHIDASAIKLDNVHPICPVDRTMDIWRSYSAMMAATIARAKKAANPREVIGSMDPVASRRAWEQGEVDRMNGVDVPHFEKTDIEAGSGLVVKNMDVGVNNNNVMTWRDAFIEEIMMSETINLRSAFQGERTLGQDRLRKESEISRINDLISINLYNWKRFAETNMLMLVGVESEFLNKYVGLEDEVSDEFPGQYADGKVRGVVKDIKEFPFNVIVSINNENQAKKEIEILQLTSSLETLASVAPGSKGVTKLAYNLAKIQNPGMTLSEQDFAPAQAPATPEAGGVGNLMAQAGGPQQPEVF